VRMIEELTGKDFPTLGTLLKVRNTQKKTNIHINNLINFIQY